MDAKPNVDVHCAGRQKCWFSAAGIEFKDPCPQKFKILTVTYQCVFKGENSFL